MKPTDSRSAYRLQRIRDLILDRDMDLRQIADALHMTRTASLKAYMTYLCGRWQAHVCGWRPACRNGERYPVYRAGKGVNVPKPAPKTPAEVMRAYWRRNGRGAIIKAKPFEALFND